MVEGVCIFYQAGFEGVVAALGIGDVGEGILPVGCWTKEAEEASGEKGVEEVLGKAIRFVDGGGAIGMEKVEFSPKGSANEAAGGAGDTSEGVV
jgi:hypothetical protein